VLALFAAATCGSASTIVLKRGPHQHPLVVNATGTLVGFVVCGAASFIAREPHALPHEARAILPILYLAIMGSLVAYGLYVWLVGHWEVTRISFIAVVVPVVAVLLGALVRHERLTAAHRAGSLLVLVGLALGILSDRRRAAAAAAPALAGAREA
jgi:drug/metabolite transporter (DMT)-like permease